MKDLKELLPIAARRGEHKRNAVWLPSSFLNDAERRVGLFVVERRVYGDNVERDWAAIGFEVRIHVPSKCADTKVATSVLALRIVQSLVSLILTIELIF